MKIREILVLFILTTFLINSFSSYSNSVFQDTKSDSIIAKNNIISLNLFQLYVGELRLSFENQRNENRYSIYGIGLMYMNNCYEMFSSDYYYGLKLFYGNKYFLIKNFYLKYLTFVKFEEDINLVMWSTSTLDRYSPIVGGSEYKQVVSYRDKYVLGIKLLFGTQNSMNNKIISDFYFGIGFRFKISTYPKSLYMSEVAYINKALYMPSIHVGYSIGYNLRKKH